MSWEQVASASSGGGRFLRLANDGDSAVIHIFTDDPHSFFQVYNQAIKKGAVVSESFEGKKTMRHAFEVFDLADGQIKVLAVSTDTAKALKNILDNYGGSFAEIDIKITRQGSGLKTKYLPIPLKLKYDDSLIEGMERIVLESDESLQPNDEAGLKVLAGEDPSLEFPPAEEPATPPEEASLEEQQQAAEAPAEEVAPPPPAAKPKPAPVAARPAPAAATPGGDPRGPLIKRVMQIFATNPKFKDLKYRQTIMKKVSQKSIVSQLSLPELQKLVPLLK